VLLPRYGLHGAVMATTVANFIALLLTYLLSNRWGMRITRGTWALAALPMLLWLGPIVSLLGLGAVLVISLSTQWLFTREERQHLLGPATDWWKKIRTYFGRRPAKTECWKISASTQELPGH
jgi:hypothetical protein